jgi:alpha-tubulin suppressor-like RCC1 family protein
MALTSAGGVYLWGSGGVEWGMEHLWSPYRVRLFPHSARFVKVSAGAFIAAALSSAGEVYRWGHSDLSLLRLKHPRPARLHLEPLRFPDGTKINDISLGDEGLLALTPAGTVYAVAVRGRDWFGNGTATGAPVAVAGLPPDASVTRIAAGFSHAAVLTENGRVWSWGSNCWGQLGDGTTNDSLVPVEAKCFPDNDPVAEVHPAAGSTAVLTVSGKVYVVGYTELDGKHLGALGHILPMRRVTGFPKGTRIVTMSAGPLHWLALDSDGQVWAWGYGGDGALGDDVVKTRSEPVLVRGFPRDLEIAQVAAGGRHSLALATDGSMCAWGTNENAELGIGRREQWRQHPTRVQWAQ